VISGGNVDSALLFRIVRQVMTRHGRILRFSVLLEDVPGALADLLAIIAEERGNILHILHSPGDGDVPVQVARVNFEIETRGQDHTESILSAIGGAGYTFTAG